MNIIEFWICVLVLFQALPVLVLTFAYHFSINPNSQSIERSMVSLIVPFRNEPKIGDLINDLLDQDYPADKYEIILVDDHSSKEQIIEVEKLIQEKAVRISLVRLMENQIGKKAAITAGVSMAMNGLVVTTDADCRMEKYWLNETVSCFKRKKADMLLGSVLVRPTRTLLGRIQELEHFGFRTITQGSAAIGIPVLNTGANLCFKRDLFLELKGFEGNENISSGDDIFLLLKAKSSGRKIVGCMSVNALVYTNPASTSTAYFAQRYRWASKTIKYPDKTAFLYLIFDCFLRVICLGIPVFSAISGDLGSGSFVPLAGKLLIDFLLVFLPSLQGKKPGILIWFIPAFLLTAVTQLLILTWMLTGREVQWKGRTVST